MGDSAREVTDGLVHLSPGHTAQGDSRSGAVQERRYCHGALAKVAASSERRRRSVAESRAVKGASHLMKGRIVQAIEAIPCRDRDMRAAVEAVLAVVRGVR